MNVAAAFIFLIQEVVIPFIILSCFPFKTFFFFCKPGLHISFVTLIFYIVRVLPEPICALMETISLLLQPDRGQVT